MDCSPPGSPVPGILQARVLEWVALKNTASHAGLCQDIESSSLSSAVGPWCFIHPVYNCCHQLTPNSHPCFLTALSSGNQKSILCVCKSISVCACAHSCLTLCDPTGCIPPGSSVEFSRQEDCSGLSFLSLADLPNAGIHPGSPALCR